MDHHHKWNGFGSFFLIDGFLIADALVWTETSRIKIKKIDWFRWRVYHLSLYVRVHGGQRLTGAESTVKLVHEDGCRDTDYEVLSVPKVNANLYCICLSIDFWYT